MRDIFSITINKKQSEFIELIYYDGSKLQIDLENNRMLVWYDYRKEYEEWFLIDLTKELLNYYLSNKSSLLKMIEEGIVYSVKRYYKKYDDIEQKNKLSSFEKYELPDSDACLGFDFTVEEEYLSHLTKDYIINNIYNFNNEIISLNSSDNESKISYTQQASSYTIEISNWGNVNEAA